MAKKSKLKNVRSSTFGQQSPGGQLTNYGQQSSGAPMTEWFTKHISRRSVGKGLAWTAALAMAGVGNGGGGGAGIWAVIALLATLFLSWCVDAA